MLEPQKSFDSSRELSIVAKHRAGTKPAMTVTVRIVDGSDGPKVMLRRRNEMREIVFGSPIALEEQARCGMDPIVKDFGGAEYVVKCRDLIKLFL